MSGDGIIDLDEFVTFYIKRCPTVVDRLEEELDEFEAKLNRSREIETELNDEITGDLLFRSSFNSMSFVTFFPLCFQLSTMADCRHSNMQCSENAIRLFPDC